jgi:nicotinate-nucleotide pyrophosphorylase (carboxylating)
MSLNIPELKRIIRDTLKEDLGTRGDVTSLALISRDSKSTAHIIAKENGIFCGADIIRETFRQLDPKTKIRFFVQDGGRVKPGKIICTFSGKTRALLSGERTALNFIQRLSGIATLTDRFLQKARRKSLKILDTRKTTPLLRAFEKYAVLSGGGTNHRFGLYDMVLIKDNHLAALSPSHNNPILKAVESARKRWPKLKVEVECDTLKQVAQAIESRADIILLDNMTTQQMRKGVRMIKGRAKTEASGGINLKTISAIARTGVDFVSIGALTHSARALDFSMEIHLENR